MDKFVAAAQKLKLVEDTLAKIDEVVTLISAFTMDENKQDLVTSIVNNIEDIKTVVDSADEMDTIVADILKGNYLGNRKIDIILSENQSDSVSAVSYKQADVILTDGTKLSMPFLSGEAVLELTSHADIKSYIVGHTLFAQVQYTEVTVEEAVGTTLTLIRLRDADGHSSNVERVELTVNSGTAVEQKPSYYWAKTTSALQTIANRVGDIIALGNDIDKIVSLSQNIDELSALQNSLSSLLELHVNITELLKADEYAQTASTKASEASASAQTAATKASEASSSASAASQSATTATEKANQIKAIAVQANTLAAGQSAAVAYDSAANKFTFSIPQGLKGDKGDPLTISAKGLKANRSMYDEQPINFSYLATDEGLLYFKMSSTSGDWGDGLAFGKGDKGDPGDDGDGVDTIAWLSTTDASNVKGVAGATDTYRITMTSGNTFDFEVTNGQDGLLEVSFSMLTNKPTTLEGYGITDANTKTEVASAIATAIANIVNSSPATLDTLQELATALNNDANFATTVTNALGLKAPLASPALTGTPTAPTAAVGTNTTQIASTAFVKAEITNQKASQTVYGTAKIYLSGGNLYIVTT